MLAQIHSFMPEGIDPLACEIEVDIADHDLPKTTSVGLSDAVKSSKSIGAYRLYTITRLSFLRMVGQIVLVIAMQSR